MVAITHPEALIASFRIHNVGIVHAVSTSVDRVSIQGIFCSIGIKKQITILSLKDGPNPRIRVSTLERDSEAHVVLNQRINPEVVRDLIRLFDRRRAVIRTNSSHPNFLKGEIVYLNNQERYGII